MSELSEAAPLSAGDQPLAGTVVGDGREVVAYVTGDIDVATCGRLRDAIEPHLGPHQHVTLDLSGVTFMDSSCLGVLEHARTKLTEDGGSLVLRNPSRAAHLLLSAAGMTLLFAIQIG
jgi:anti-anti-sigma factor